MIGQRLDKALSFFPEIKTRSRAEHLIESSLILVNGVSQKPSYKVRPGDEFLITLIEENQEEILPLDLSLEILFEDQDLIVLNKPAGLVVHPAAGHSQDTLVNALVHHTKDLSMKFGEKRPGIVHRLDRDTSGLLVVAKNDFAHEKLSADFKKRAIHRIYFALCIGKVKNKSGKIQSYLARHPVDRKRFASVIDDSKKIIREQTEGISGKWSVTNYRVLNEHPSGLCYVQLKLETGRTHQIRVHLSEIGLPIAGDELYGASKKLKQITSSEVRQKISKIPRFALHASELGFQHPRTGQNLMFKVDWPEDLKSYIDDFGLSHVQKK